MWPARRMTIQPRESLPSSRGHLGRAAALIPGRLAGAVLRYGRHWRCHMTQTQIDHASLAKDRAAIRWSYLSGTSDTPLLGMTIGDALDRTVARFPDRDALISRHQGLRYTWSTLQNEVNRFARGLMALGIE